MSINSTEYCEAILSNYSILSVGIKIRIKIRIKEIEYVEESINVGVCGGSM